MESKKKLKETKTTMGNEQPRQPYGAVSQNLELAFDVGHSSIGWSVFQSPANARPIANTAINLPEILGCGVVTFGADDCLASKRRDYRRQRRHVRSTRMRISRLKQFLAHLGVLSQQQLDQPGCAWPWLLAARVLRGGPTLSWPELWDVIRWYAHNRGYDGNRRWSGLNLEEAEDAEKVQNARALYEKHGTRTMAETFCAVSGLDPLGTKKSCHLPGDQRPKALNAAFPREDVEGEVNRILQRHCGVLKKVDEKLIKTLLTDWQTIPCPALSLPGRYQGGLLFGQLVPRFENRIISTCPITYERIYQAVLEKTGDTAKATHEAAQRSKVPSRECVEFYRFRWAMQLANIKIAHDNGRDARPLTVAERQQIHQRMLERGCLTAVELKKVVREIVGHDRNNLDQMLMHPDAKEALILDPIKKLIISEPLSLIWRGLPVPLQKRAAGKWRRGKMLRIRNILDWLETPLRQSIQSTLKDYVDTENTKKKRKEAPLELSALLDQPLKIKLLDQRAAYTREVMDEAWQDVMERGIHPKEKGGCLFRDEAIRTAQLQRAIDDQTNNHLVRHRLRILERLHTDLLKTYADNDASRVGRVTIEVNRDLRELSGKTRKEQEQDLGLRLSNFKSVVKKLEQAFEGKNIKITPGLIRKARIAEDLGWTCPYTDKTYDAFDLLHCKVDKDHIIPRSERASDSLDSLVITFAEVNKMKGKRTARQFIEEFQGKTVEGAPHLSIRTATNYENWVKGLETFKGHEDDKKRKKRRKEFLLLRDYVEKDFTPRDLTQTSQLVRLGAQILQRAYGQVSQPPVITSLPGSVTGTVRKGWNLLGCLSAANPEVLDEDGQVRTKTEIRDITHLHHALDACVLALASHYLPRDGALWELMVKRNLNAAEQTRLKMATGGLFATQADGRFGLVDLPDGIKEQLRQRLAERRVVQHIPADMSGMQVKETVWRVFELADPHPSAQRLARWFKAAGIKIPEPNAVNVLIVCRKRLTSADGESGKVLHETPTWRWVYNDIAKSKLIGLHPAPNSTAKLKQIKAVKIVGDNFGIAIDPEPRVIRFHKVWHQLNELQKLNDNRPVRVIRKGDIIKVRTGTRSGIWKVNSIKDTQAYGLALDLSMPDHLGLDRGNAPIRSLLENGLEIIKSSLVGYDSKSIEVTPKKKRPRKSKIVD